MTFKKIVCHEDYLDAVKTELQTASMEKTCNDKKQVAICNVCP